MNKNKLFFLMEKINPDFKNPLNEVSSDVESMEDTMNSNPTLRIKNSRINNPQEFKSAFEAWFNTLGLDPNKISIGRIKADIDDILRRKGYNQ